MCRNKWLAPVIPVLVLIVIGGVAIGQTQTSFEILVDAQFTDTNLRPVIEPHLNRAIKPPDTSLAWSPFRANLTNIMCTNARIGNAWLLTTNGPELWINVRCAPREKSRKIGACWVGVVLPHDLELGTRSKVLVCLCPTTFMLEARFDATTVQYSWAYIRGFASM